MKLDELMGFKFLQIVNLKRQVMERRIRELGLSRTQWQLLVWTNILGTPCSQKDLLKSMEIDQAHLARTLEQLEKSQLVIREPIEGNRRSLAVTLTSKGKTMMKKIESALKEENKIMIQGIGKNNVKQLETLLDKVRSNLQSDIKISIIHKL